MTESGATFGVREAVHRGYNLMATVIFGLVGLAFGSDLFVETDMVDKIDNSLLALIAVLALVWYLTGRHSVERSRMPIVLAGAALLVQILGVAIEMGDPTAIGDDIPGMIIFVPLLIILAVLGTVNDRLVAAAKS